MSDSLLLQPLGNSLNQTLGLVLSKNRKRCSNRQTGSRKTQVPVKLQGQFQDKVQMLVAVGVAAAVQDHRWLHSWTVDLATLLHPLACTCISRWMPSVMAPTMYVGCSYTTVKFLMLSDRPWKNARDAFYKDTNESILTSCINVGSPPASPAKLPGLQVIPPISLFSLLPSRVSGPRPAESKTGESGRSTIYLL